VPLATEEAAAIGANVVLDDGLYDELGAWVDRHYRDQLTPADLADPKLARETMEALDALTRLLRLGSVYDFQR
jgi:succinylarginine dihydrolase